MKTLSIKTVTLKQMVSKAVKGASCNKMIPLTELIAIELLNNTLTLTTSDATNYLYIRQVDVVGDDFYAVVKVDVFSKLVAKMTSEDIKLALGTNALKVTGNGSYSIELPLDEEGQPIKYPNPAFAKELTVDSDCEIQLSTVKTILNTNKPALATTMESPCYTGYYVGDSVVSTDTYKICATKVKLFDKPFLISTEMMDLLGVIDSEKIKVNFNSDGSLTFITDTCAVHGTPLDGIEDYAINAIQGLIDLEFDSMCKLHKSVVIGVLDRLSLFVSAYDRNAIYLTFTKDGILVSNKALSSAETIPFAESTNFKDFTCAIDVNMLASQIKAQSTDVIELWYGKNNAIKMVDGNVVQIVALAEDDRVQ